MDFWETEAMQNKPKRKRAGTPVFVKGSQKARVRRSEEEAAADPGVGGRLDPTEAGRTGSSHTPGNERSADSLTHDAGGPARRPKRSRSAGWRTGLGGTLGFTVAVP